MIHWLTEDALFPTMIGGFLTISLLAMAVYAGDKTMLKISLLVGLITATIFGIEQYIVTDKEKAYALVYEGAAAARENNFEPILAMVKSDQKDIINRARRMLVDVHFDNVRVVGFNSFENQPDKTPQTAQIDFVVFGSGRKGATGGPFNFAVTLDLEMVDEQWKVTGYQLRNPRGGLHP